MGWKIVQDRLNPRASVAVRNSAGIAFGILCWIEADRLMIELDGELAAGEGCELRVDVTPLAGTVLVRGRTIRQLVTASDEMPRYVVRLIEVPEAELAAYNAWISQISTGGTISDLSVLSTWSNRHVASGAERSAGVARSEAREETRSTTSSPGSSVSVPPMASRDRLREALRGLTRRAETDVRK